MIYQAQSDQLKHALMNLPITYTILHLYAVQKLAGSQLNLPIMRIFQMTLDIVLRASLCTLSSGNKFYSTLTRSALSLSFVIGRIQQPSSRPSDQPSNRTSPREQSAQKSIGIHQRLKPLKIIRFMNWCLFSIS